MYSHVVYGGGRRRYGGAGRNSLNIYSKKKLSLMIEAHHTEHDGGG